MKKNKFNTGEGIFFNKIVEQLVEFLVDITVIASFLFILMR